MDSKAKKRTWLIIGALLVLGAALFALWYFFLRGNSGDTVYVMPVSSVAEFGTGSSNRFSGIVEAQQTVDFRKDNTKTIKTTYVSEGDHVEVGDILFSYDTDAIKLQISQKKLDIQREQAAITSNNEMIALTDDDLEKQRLRNENKQIEYRIKAIRNELNSLEASMAETDVVSTVEGTVKHVSDGTEAEDVYISVMKSGDYVIKGKVNELNLSQISQGTQVAVHSRIDGSVWNGSVSRIETGQPADEKEYGFYVSDEMSTSSKYYFYIELESSSGLFLGQHVVVEPLGAAVRKGLWLFEDYIIGADGDSPYVWADSNGRIKKTYVTLGEYDAMIGSWQITEGLTINDYIAYPDGNISDGMKTTTEYSEESYEGVESGEWEVSYAEPEEESGEFFFGAEVPEDDAE